MPARGSALPPPFGLARNGALVIGTADGDIVTVDPATGTTTPLITGPTIDSGPFFSNDGQRILFDRAAASAPDLKHVVHRECRWVGRPAGVPDRARTSPGSNGHRTVDRALADRNGRMGRARSRPSISRRVRGPRFRSISTSRPRCGGRTTTRSWSPRKPATTSRSGSSTRMAPACARSRSPSTRSMSRRCHQTARGSPTPRGSPSSRAGSESSTSMPVATTRSRPTTPTITSGSHRRSRPTGPRSWSTDSSRAPTSRRWRFFAQMAPGRRSSWDRDREPARQSVLLARRDADPGGVPSPQDVLDLRRQRQERA